VVGGAGSRLSTWFIYLSIINPGSKLANGNSLYKTYLFRRKMINGHLSGWWCNLVVWSIIVGTGHVPLFLVATDIKKPGKNV
jgi:hypothetical protein